MPIGEGSPWRSEHLRIAPEDVKSVNEDLRRHGVVNAAFDEKGRAVAHSRQGRNGLLKFMNVRDNDAGYGDYAGR